MRLYQAHVSAMVPFQCFVPKHHIVFHLIAGMRWFGNPTLYSNWLDEAMNKTLKSMAKTCSQAVFEAVLLLRARDVFSAAPKRKRPRAS